MESEESCPLFDSLLQLKRDDGASNRTLP